MKQTTDLLVISSYPPKNQTHGEHVVGVASYTKNTLVSMVAACPGTIAITVLAEKLPRQDNTSQDEGITVQRVWERGSIFVFDNLFWTIVLQYRKTKDIVIAYELAMFGGLAQTLFFPLFIFSLRLTGKRVTLVLHQVIRNVNDVAGHANISPHSAKTFWFNTMLRCFYTSLLFFSSRIIVFDAVLTQYLHHFGSTRHVRVIPHGVEQPPQLPDSHKARTTLGLPYDTFVVMVFGFITWYKGTDWIVDAFANAPASFTEQTQLLVAGGPNPNRAKFPYYKAYLQQLTATAQDSGAIISGFVSEDTIGAYYAAADLVVFPYRTLMSASGPLSLALSYEKPFLLSSVLAPVLRTTDLAQAMQECGLTDTDITYSSEAQLYEKITQYRTDEVFRNRVRALAAMMKARRQFVAIGSQYVAALQEGAA